MKIESHHLDIARQVQCTHTSNRLNNDISLIVIHCISLPAGHFGGDSIENLFCNSLDTSVHNDFADLEGVEVSSHLLVRRDGSVLQFVPFDQCAWHAGESIFLGRSACNDFSVGIELEGSDKSKFSDSQYQALAAISRLLISAYGIPEENIVGHEDIAPGRKTDPGPLFDWERFRKMVSRV